MTGTTVWDIIYATNNIFTIRHLGTAIFLGGLCLWGTPGFCAPADTRLSFQEALATAFQNNKDIQIQERAVEAARADIRNAFSGFLPKINGTTSYTHNDAVLTLPTAIDKTMKRDLGFFTGYKNDYRLGGSINETVYDGGATIAGWNKSHIALKIQEETLRAKKLDIEFETKRLYYGLLLAAETERIAQDLVSQSQSHAEDVARKFSQGTASRFETLQARVQVSKLMPELVKAKNSTNLIAADLKKILGLKMQDSLRASESLTYTRMDIREDDFLRTALLHKPEMILKVLGVDLNKWEIDLAKSGMRPTIGANAAFNMGTDDLGLMFNERHNNWNVGVAVTVPLFDGFSTKAKVDAAKARYAQAALGKDDLVDRVAVELRRACLDLEQAHAIIQSQEDGVAEAVEALRLANVSYQNGEATNLDVMDTQVALGQIQKSLSEGIYDYIMAKADLDRTMGTPTWENARNEQKN